MSAKKPRTTHAVYWPKPGREKQVLALLKDQWPVLHKAGLVTDTPALVFTAKEKRTGRTHFIEILTWIDDKVAGRAHNKKAVMAIWGPMSTLLETGRTADWMVVKPVKLNS